MREHTFLLSTLLQSNTRFNLDVYVVLSLIINIKYAALLVVKHIDYCTNDNNGLRFNK